MPCPAMSPNLRCCAPAGLRQLATSAGIDEAAAEPSPPWLPAPAATVALAAAAGDHIATTSALSPGRLAAAVQQQMLQQVLAGAKPGAR